MINPLVVWIWIGVVVTVFGTCVALAPNAAQLKSPVQVKVLVPEKARMLETAGVAK
jgi:cytochrome c biogenesis factor